MNGRLSHMRAVITGGSHGIGLGIAQAFAAEGAELWLIARNPEKLASAAELLSIHGVTVRVSEADLTDPSAVDRVGMEIASEWERLDVLINNAGMARFTCFGDVTLLRKFSRRSNSIC